mmetsp:Transcript_5384/g.8848  ORF Transcript_5384/g.8848 Transcript_5384/m.8848 type:complete len:437 (-) Transcript_5384:167-1477(-)
MTMVADHIAVPEPDLNGRWSHVLKLLGRSGPLASPGFTPGIETFEFIRENCKILVIGAGGLGCELLKDLALSGFRNLHVIDLDTIELSNLNRQFLFRKADVGKSKAEVAARFVNERVAGARVHPYMGKIQDRDEEFYRQFNLIVLGLDSIEARRWINALVCKMVDYDDEGNPRQETIIPIIDGGTEGFKGHARVIIPGMTSCFECTLELFPPQTTFPLCTIAETPRSAAHCIEWAHLIQWDKEWPGEKFDADRVDHMQWMYETSRKRADNYGISGVTYSMTLGVVKNIVPAIASTNAVIAAACANEALKLASGASGMLSNFMMYVGNEGTYTHTFESSRNPECPVCSTKPVTITLPAQKSLQALILMLQEDERFRLKAPSLRSDGRSLYMRQPAVLETATRPNLDKALSELLTSGSTVDVTDCLLPVSLTLNIVFS